MSKTKYSYTIYVNGNEMQTIRCRPSAFDTFNFYKVGNWYNYPDPDGKVRTVSMVRSDGKVFTQEPE